MKRILAGPHAVIEALRATPGAIEVVCLAESLRSLTTKDIEDMARRARVECEVMPKESLDALAGKLHHQGVIAITGDYPYVDLVALLEHAQTHPHPLLVVLDQIQDPRNLGAILRSAHAFGACGVILPKDRAAKITAAAVRTSVGASELMKVCRITNLARTLDELKDAGYCVHGADAEAQDPLSAMSWSGRTALVMGNEGRGLRRLTAAHCDRLFKIPMATDFDSLNVGAAAAIALYEASKQRSLNGKPD
jgi:23S rRNA (guanosine2251-2'-O)-methyltransferase